MTSLTPAAVRDALEPVKVGRLRRVPPEAVAAFRARLRAEARAGAA